MPVKHLISPGIGFSPGSIKYIITRGLISGVQAPYVEAVLYTKLSTALSSTIVSNRIYPYQLPQNPVYPSITLRRVSSIQESYITGPGDTEYSRFQFDCYGTTYAIAKEAAKELRDALVGISETISGIIICSIHFRNEIDRFDDRADVYDIMIDLRIGWRIA